jgi:hypothetical protein
MPVQPTARRDECEIHGEATHSPRRSTPRISPRTGCAGIACRLCASEKQSSFPTEIAIHLPGLGALHVFLFPQVVVCMDCGFTEFSIPETELPRLAKDDSSAA